MIACIVQFPARLGSGRRSSRRAPWRSYSLRQPRWRWARSRYRPSRSGRTRPRDVTSRRYALEFAPKALRALESLTGPWSNASRPRRIRCAKIRGPRARRCSQECTEFCGSGSQASTGSCTRSTMTGWWSWSWTPVIVGGSTVSALADGSEPTRGLDHDATRHAGRTVVRFIKDASFVQVVTTMRFTLKPGTGTGDRRAVLVVLRYRGGVTGRA